MNPPDKLRGILALKHRNEVTMDTKSTANLKNPTQKTATGGKTYDMAYIAVFTVLIAICSWISIPTVVPFTLQTFAVFLAVSILGGKRGTMAVTLYVLLGAIGVPVFAGFTGGLGVILRNTGGYIIGFILSALIMWLMESIFLKKLHGKQALIMQAVSMVLGLLACYAAGTIWFMLVYMKEAGPIGLTTVLGWCVIPFLIPDALKIALALMLGNALRGPLGKIMNRS